jgi:hypothetical protein
MDTPTAADVRAWSQVDFANLGYPEGQQPDPLQVWVDRAVAYVTGASGRTIDANFSGDSWMVPLAEMAVQLCTEMMVFEAQEDYLETAADDVVQSFTAGNYSEVRVDPAKRAVMRALNGNPALGRAMWPFMTAEAQDAWQQLTTGKNAPAFDTTEVDWSGTGFGPYEPVPGAWYAGGAGGWGDLDSG